MKIENRDLMLQRTQEQILDREQINSRNSVIRQVIKRMEEMAN